MATIKYPAYVEDNWDKLRDAVRRFDEDIFSGDAIEALAEIEDIVVDSVILPIRARIKDLYGSSDDRSLDDVLEKLRGLAKTSEELKLLDNIDRRSDEVEALSKAVIQELVQRENLKINELLGQNKGTLDDLLEIAIEKLESLTGDLSLGVEGTLKELDIVFRTLPRQIIPSDDIGGILPGNGEGVKEKPELGVNKIALFVEFLKENSVYTDNIVAFVGKNEPNVMRKNSYVLFVIPGLKKGVFVNVDYGEATFVIDMQQVNDDSKRILFLSKSELQLIPGTKKIIFSESNVDAWKDGLKRALFMEGYEMPRIEGGRKAKMREYLDETMAMDAEYFNNKEYVLYDLTEFAKKAFGDDFVEDTDLTTLGKKRMIDLNASSTFKSVRAVCSNGEEFRLQYYLRKASEFLGIGRRGKIAETLSKLKEIAGYKIMDTEYFNNKEYVLYDLTEFAAKAFNINQSLDNYRELAEERIKDLSTTHENVRITCNNGDEITLQTYLRKASPFVGGTGVEALNILKKIAGFEKVQMDAEYFSNKENVLYDLTEFAKKAFGDDFVEDTDLTTLGKKRMIDLSSSYLGVPAVCSNGEELKLQAYLIRAGRFLGIKGLGEILSKLKEIAGFEI